MPLPQTPAWCQAESGAQVGFSCSLKPGWLGAPRRRAALSSPPHSPQSSAGPGSSVAPESMCPSFRTQGLPNCHSVPIGPLCMC